MTRYYYLLTAIAVLLLSFSSTGCTEAETAREVSDPVPAFSVDPFWPQPLPNNWLIGQVSGVSVDSEDHVWIIHRPGSLGELEVGETLASSELTYTPAPPVIQFNSDGELIRAWGGPGEGFNWPESEHGIFIDHEDHVWINGGGSSHHQVLKFSKDGTFLMEIGKAGETGGNNDTTLLGYPTDFAVDPIANEVYIADGYVNNRVVVFDANTGQYKRHWGAYGHKPEDFYDPDKLTSEQYNTPHDVKISDDGRVYLADRGNNRIQVYEKDGTFVFEEFIEKKTPGYGSVWNIDFSHDPQQSFIYVADGTNQRVWILKRDNLEVISHFGTIGRYAGQFIWLHNVATDSKGNIYTGEVFSGRRVQKFNHRSVH